ncbi:MAG: hypothetical protein KatS3mg036_0299 [Ignavibacterium sp.]|nr:MAG: hypothetical protein KatS3mg036_0299 [Ignavibacterium sp.]
MVKSFWILLCYMLLIKILKKLVREISTKELGIHTICGLYAIDDYHLYGIDRNQQHFFEIVFDRDYNVIKCDLVKLELPCAGK